MYKNLFRFLCFFSLFMLIVFTGCDGGSESYEDTLVCLGNSLTAGYGSAIDPPLNTDKSKAYPALLGDRVKMEVVNSGISGNTTEDALGRLDSGVIEHDPDIVVIELGANDFFRSVDVATTTSNLQAVIEYIDNGSRKIYLAKFYTETVGRAFLDDHDITDPAEQTIILNNYDAMFSALVADYGVELIEDIWAGVWGVPENMFSDGIHPSASGYAVMAKNYFAAMEPYLQSQGYVK